MAQLVDMLGLHGVPGEALSEATYFACLRVLSEGVGKLPLKVLQKTEEKGVDERHDLHLYEVLRYRPNPYMTATRFWSSVETARNHFGNAFVRIEGAGDKLELYQMPSDEVTVWWDDAKILGKDAAVWLVWKTPSGKAYKIPYDSALHFRTWLSFDGMVGLPVQDILKSTLQGNLTSQNLLNRMYENGFTTKAVLYYTGNLEDGREKTYIKNVEKYATGKVDGAKSILPIPVGSKLEPLNIKLTDNQFIEIKKYSALQVAAAFGVKPNQINDYEKTSYANSESQQLAFLVDTLLWILKDYEEEIIFKLLSKEMRSKGNIAKFNTAVMLRADAKTQLEALAMAVNNNLYTPNEARALIDYPAKKGGDELLGNGNLIPTALAGMQYRQKGDEDT